MGQGEMAGAVSLFGDTVAGAQSKTSWQRVHEGSGGWRSLLGSKCHHFLPVGPQATFPLNFNPPPPTAKWGMIISTSLNFTATKV